MTPCALPPGSYFGRPAIERRSGGARVVVTDYTAGQRLPRHSHERPYLCVTLRGAYEESAGERTHGRSRGGLVLNTLGDVHRDRIIADARCANIEFPSAWLDEERGDARTLYASVAPDSSLLLRLERALSRAQTAPAISLEETILSLIAAARRRARSRPGAPPPRWLDAVLEFVRDADPRSISLDAAAQVAGVHPAHLAREFRRHTGFTLRDAARRARAHAAAKSIRQTSLPLGVIAARAGYADQAHLTRAIRAFLGTTPGALRRGEAADAQP